MGVTQNIFPFYLHSLRRWQKPRNYNNTFKFQDLVLLEYSVEKVPLCLSVTPLSLHSCSSASSVLQDRACLLQPIQIHFLFELLQVHVPHEGTPNFSFSNHVPENSRIPCRISRGLIDVWSESPLTILVLLKIKVLSSCVVHLNFL